MREDKSYSSKSAPRITRREALRSGAALAGLLAAGAPRMAPAFAAEGEEGSAPRPNILFIMGDDHTSQAWGCYEGRLSEFAHTPNIDRLAEQGARLRNVFVENSICAPSRATILTGQYSNRHGVKTLRDGLDPQIDHVGKRLRQGGYETALVGKWHLKEPPSGFDFWSIIRGQGQYRDPVMFEGDFGAGEVQDGQFSADAFTNKALSWLKEREGDRPFCLMLHFKATHESWQFPERFADLYDDVTFPEPASLFGGTGPENSRVPGWPLEILTERMTTQDRYGAGRLTLETDDPRERRRATYQKLIRDFLRCGAAIDDNIGRVLEYLDRAGLAEDTIVIYTSDQGYFLGEHNYFDKRFMLEESIRMPFVVRYPREIEAGTVLDDIILNVDFAPTFLDYAGLEAPSTMQGRSFRANLQGETPGDWREAMYYRYYMDSERRPSHFGIRTHDHKLIYYDGMTDRPESRRWEFYDLDKDPHENRNAYDDPEHGDTIAALKERLRRLQEELDDVP